jgi:hypothetical protein
MSTPEQYLHTCFLRDGRGRIISTREPTPARGPLFCLVRSANRCAWGIHAHVPEALVQALDERARSEPPAPDFRKAPIHAGEYRRLLAGYLSSQHRASVEPLEQSGPAMVFPDPPAVVAPHGLAGADIVPIEDERLLARAFSGWAVGEIASGRAPVLAAIEAGHAVSVCFCARGSSVAAEAGVETAAPYRGRGLALHVTAAWAELLRAGGRVPLYSTQWTNRASLAVARKLGLSMYAGTWLLADPGGSDSH